MKRRGTVFKSPEQAKKSISVDSSVAIDWDLCFLCQKHGSEKLQCSKDARKDVNACECYGKLSERILKFAELNALPLPLDISLLQGNEIHLSDSLFSNTAKFHKSCKTRFDQGKLDRAIKQSENDPSAVTSDSEFTSRRISSPKLKVCFFCNQPADNKKPLHLALSSQIYNRVRRCADILEDSLLHAKLSYGDMKAQDALYHRLCLINLYRRASVCHIGDEITDADRKLHGIAFAEVVPFVEESISESLDVFPLFKLSDLIKMYEEQLLELGVKREARTHSTRFKNRLLSRLDDLSAHNDGREVVLIVKSSIGEVAAAAANINYDDDGYILSKAASILRRLVFWLKLL